MFPAYKTVPFATAEKVIIFLGLIASALLSLMVTSCQKPPLNQSPASAAFTETLNKARYIYNISPKKGIRFLDSALAYGKPTGVSNQFDVYEMHYTYFYRVKADYAKSMLCADSMLNLIVKSHDAKTYGKQLGVAYFSKGDVFFSMGQFPDAYKYYYLGEMTGEKNFNECTLSEYSYRMGMIMYRQEHFMVAAGYFKESFSKAQACASNFVTFYRNQEVLDNIAISYVKADMPNDAASYFVKTLNYLNGEGNKYPENSNLIEVARAVVYGNQAQLYNANGEYARAAGLLKKSIAINLQKGNDNRDAEMNEVKLAAIYNQLGDSNNLYSLLKNIKIQLDSVPYAAVSVDWNHLMAMYYQHQKDLSKALFYFNRYDFLKDSLAKTTRKLRESDVKQQFKDFESQSTITALKNDNDVQEVFLVVALVYAVMALAIILLIFLNWKRSKKNIEALSELNAQISGQKNSLQMAIANLEQSDKEKDRILRAVAHDLRNPIGGIASLTSLMLTEGKLNAGQTELLQLIQNTTSNSLELINEILEATGLMPGGEIKKQMVDINTLLKNSVELLRFKAAEKNQRITLEVLKAPEELYINSEKMWRVISNLINNAIKFSPRGSVINVLAISESNSMCFSVNDSGIGIPDEIKHQVFNMFTQARRIGTSGEPSFGLGLSISKQIVDSHNGEIWFESDAGEGTTFYVRLKKEK